MSKTKKSIFQQVGEKDTEITRRENKTLESFQLSLMQGKQLLRTDKPRQADESVITIAENRQYSKFQILSFALRAFGSVVDEDTYNVHIMPLITKTHALNKTTNQEQRDAIIEECFDTLSNLVPQLLLEPENVIQFEDKFIEIMDAQPLRFGGGKKSRRRLGGKSRRRLGKSRRRLGKSRRRLGKSRRRG